MLLQHSDVGLNQLQAIRYIESQKKTHWPDKQQAMLIKELITVHGYTIYSDLTLKQTFVVLEQYQSLPEILEAVDEDSAAKTLEDGYIECYGDFNFEDALEYYCNDESKTAIIASLDEAGIPTHDTDEPQEPLSLEQRVSLSDYISDAVSKAYLWAYEAAMYDAYHAHFESYILNDLDYVHVDMKDNIYTISIQIEVLHEHLVDHLDNSPDEDTDWIITDCIDTTLTDAKDVGMSEFDERYCHIDVEPHFHDNLLDCLADI